MRDMAASPVRTILDASPYFLFFGLMDSLAVFLCVWVITSLFMGYTIGISALSIVVAALISFALLAMKNKSSPPHKARELKTHFTLGENKVDAVNIFPFIGVAMLIVLVMGVIFFGVQGGYDLSADAAPSVAASFIKSHIPLSYAPYFDVLFFYQLGLPLLVSQFTSIGIPSHQAAWGLGLLGIIFCFFALVRWSIRLTGKQEAAYAVGVLFIGMRLPFLDLLVGEYALLFSFGIGLLAAFWAEENKILGGIGFAGAAITHPYMAIILFLFWMLAGNFVTLGQRFIGILQVAGIAFVGFFPVIWNQGIPYLQLAQAGQISASEGALPSISSIAPLPIFFGIISVAIALFALIHLRQRAWNNPLIRKLGGLVIVALLGYLLFLFIPNAIFHSKFLELGWSGLLLFSSAYLALAIPRKWLPSVLFCILVIGAAINFSSDDLNRLAIGSKATLREAHFAERFSSTRADLPPARVLFFTPHSGKMAQYSNQIPVIATSANFTLAVHSIRTPAVKKILEETRIAKEAMEKNCVDCLGELDFDYLVIDTQRTPLLELKTPLIVNDGFAVYAWD